MGLVRGRYFYQCTRVRGRVICRYVASGEDARLIAALVESDRREREQAKALAAEQRRLYDAECRRGEGLRGVATVLLEALGYWRPQRRVWRRRRRMGAARALPA